MCQLTLPVSVTNRLTEVLMIYHYESCLGQQTDILKGGQTKDKHLNKLDRVRLSFLEQQRPSDLQVLCHRFKQNMLLVYG